MESDYDNLRVLLVDNGSKARVNQGLRDIAGKEENVEVFRLEKNLGFCEGNNKGLMFLLKRFPKTEYIFFVNDDLVMDPDTVSSLVTASRDHPDFGVFGPLVCEYNEKDRIQSAGLRVNHRRGETVFLHRGGNREEIKGFHEVDCVSGCAMFVRRELVENDFLDPKYFTYWEEADFQYRMRTEGYKIGLAADTCVYHYGSATAGRNKGKGLYYEIRNRIIFHKKWSAGIAEDIIFHPYTVFFQVPAKVLKWTIIKGQANIIAYSLFGLLDGYLERWDRSVDQA